MVGFENFTGFKIFLDFKSIRGPGSFLGFENFVAYLQRYIINEKSNKNLYFMKFSDSGGIFLSTIRYALKSGVRNIKFVVFAIEALRRIVGEIASSSTFLVTFDVT